MGTKATLGWQIGSTAIRLEHSQRYEVELRLGATDEFHIIRCIEYWDIELRRYPSYEHIAVLVD